MYRDLCISVNGACVFELFRCDTHIFHKASKQQVDQVFVLLIYFPIFFAIFGVSLENYNILERLYKIFIYVITNKCALYYTTFGKKFSNSRKTSTSITKKLYEHILKGINLYACVCMCARARARVCVYVFVCV